MSGLSTVDLYTALRALVLPLVQAVDPAADVFVARIPPTATPPGTNRPTVSLRLFDRGYPRTTGLDGGAETVGKLELMVYWRGDANAAQLETLVDAMQSRLATVGGLRDTAGGVAYGLRLTARDAIVAPGGNADVDLLTARSVYQLTEHPARLVFPS